MIVFPPRGYTSGEIRIFRGMEVGGDEKELLTVVLTVKNRKELLSETLRSISSQRALPAGMVTLVAVDNGSTDGAYNLLEYWVAYDAPEWLRVELLTEPRLGVCTARNTGLRAARGEWVMFFDSDDSMTPDHLASVVAAIDRSGRTADLIYWDVAFAGRNGKIGIHRAVPVGDVWYNVIIRGMLSTQRYCCRRAAVVAAGGWDEELEVWNDWELSVRIVAGGVSLSEKPGKPTVIVREHADSITGSRFADKAGKREMAMDKVRSFARRNGLDRVARLTDMKGAVLAGDYAREGEAGLGRKLIESLAGYGAVSCRKLQIIAMSERLLGRGATLVTSVIERL